MARYEPRGDGKCVGINDIIFVSTSGLIEGAAYSKTAYTMAEISLPNYAKVGLEPNLTYYKVYFDAPFIMNSLKVP